MSAPAVVDRAATLPETAESARAELSIEAAVKSSKEPMVSQW